MGKAATLISQDCEKVRKMSSEVLDIFWTPMSVILGTLLLHSVIGVASLVGVGLLIILLPVQACNVRRLAASRRRGRRASDERVGLMHELVVGIRTIKLLAWERPLVTKVGDAYLRLV